MAASSQKSAERKPNPIPNSKPWVKGQSGNPAGRPKDILTQALRALMTPEEAQALAKSTIALAKSGDVNALKVVWDRLEGKALDRKEVGDPGDFERLAALRDLSPDELRSLITTVKDRKAEQVRKASA